MIGSIALILAAVSSVSPDRHEGVWRFVPAPEQHCIEQVRRAQAAPARPQRLGELPAAYAIRLRGDAKPVANSCFAPGSSF